MPKKDKTTTLSGIEMLIEQKKEANKALKKLLLQIKQFPSSPAKK